MMQIRLYGWLGREGLHLALLNLQIMFMVQIKVQLSDSQTVFDRNMQNTLIREELIGNKKIREVAGLNLHLAFSFSPDRDLANTLTWPEKKKHRTIGWDFAYIYYLHNTF